MLKLTAFLKKFCIHKLKIGMGREAPSAIHHFFISITTIINFFNSNMQKKFFFSSHVKCGDQLHVIFRFK